MTGITVTHLFRFFIVAVCCLIIGYPHQAKCFNSPLEPYVGNWKLETQDNMNNFYIALGVGAFNRWLASTTTPHLYITMDGKDKLTVVSWAIKYRTATTLFDQEVYKDAIDGRKTKVVNIIKNGKWVSVERWLDSNGDEKIAKYIYDISPNQMIINMSVDDVNAVQCYKRIP